MRDDLSITTQLARAPRALRKQVRRVLATRYYRRYFEERPDHVALDPLRAAAAVSTADTILFCCWGNICRSPMAARYLQAKLDELDADVTVESAGLGERSGRPSPQTAVDVAAPYGVDLADHRSRCVTTEQLAESDVVFVMDYHTYHLLVSREAPVETVFFLSVFADDGVEIPDPAGRSEETFESVYETIATATDRLAEVVASTRGPLVAP